MNPNQVKEPRTAQELIQHPSFRREIARFEDLGGTVSVTTREGTTVVTISSDVIPADIVQTFAMRLRRLDSRGFLLIEVAAPDAKT